MILIIKTKSHGLEVFKVVKAGMVVSTHFSEQGARTWVLKSN